MPLYYTYLKKREARCAGCNDWIHYGQRVYRRKGLLYHEDCDWIALENEKDVV